jgi:hypothetical protein
LALSTLLPHLEGLCLDELTLDDEMVRLHLTARARSARDPVCSRRSTRVQNMYHRTVAVLPITGRRLLRLRVRSSRCGARRCPRAPFAEPLARRSRCAAAGAMGSSGDEHFSLERAVGACLAARLATHQSGRPASAALSRSPRGPARCWSRGQRCALRRWLASDDSEAEMRRSWGRCTDRPTTECLVRAQTRW